MDVLVDAFWLVMWLGLLLVAALVLAVVICVLLVVAVRDWVMDDLDGWTQDA